MSSHEPDTRDDECPEVDAIHWLRVLKLLLSIVVLAVGVWEALSGVL